MAYLPHVPWTGRDMAAALVMSLIVANALGAGVAVVEGIAAGDTFYDILSYLIITLVLTAVAFTIGLVSGIRLPILANVFGVAMALSIGIQVAADADGASGKFIGVPADVFLSAIFSSMFFAVAWLYGTSKRRAGWDKYGFVKAKGRLPYLQAVAAWAVAFVALGIWGLISQDIKWLQPPDNTSEALDLAGGSIVVALPLVGVLVPLAEETLFRGFLLRGLLNRLTPLAALALSSLIFAVFHIDPGLYVPIFILGMAMGWVYLRTGSIWPSVFVHAIHNSFALIVTWQDIGGS